MIICLMNIVAFVAGSRMLNLSWMWNKGPRYEMEIVSLIVSSSRWLPGRRLVIVKDSERVKIRVVAKRAKNRGH